MRRERRDERNQEGGCVAERDAHDTADETQDDGFEEELEENIAGRGTNGFADADFAGTFGNGDEHNVHDADAADNKRDRGNES